MLTGNSKWVSKNKLTCALMPRPLLWLMCTWKMLKCYWLLHWIWYRLSAVNMPCTHQSQNRIHCIRAYYFTFLNLLPCKNWHGFISTNTWIFRKFFCYFIALVLKFYYLFLSIFCLDLGQMAYLLYKIITQDMYLLQKVASVCCCHIIVPD